MAEFNLPPWLTPKTEPWQAMAAGVQAGAAIGHNLLQAKALYAQSQQAAQALELRQNEFRAENESRALQNELARTKITHDAEDFATLREFLPQVSSTTSFDEISKLSVPPLHDAQNYLRLSVMLDRHKTGRAASELANEMAGKAPGTDEYLETVDRWVARAPDLALSPAIDKFRQRDATARYHALTAKTQADRLASLDAYREGRLGIAAGQLAVMQQKADQQGVTAEEKARIADLLATSRLDMNEAQRNKWLNDMTIADQRLDLARQQQLTREATLEELKRKAESDESFKTVRNEIAKLNAANKALLTDAQIKKLEADIDNFKSRLGISERNVAAREDELKLRRETSERNADLRSQELERRKKLVPRENVLRFNAEKEMLDRQNAEITPANEKPAARDARLKEYRKKLTEIEDKYLGSQVPAPVPTTVPAATNITDEFERWQKQQAK